ncbi:MAG: hypothetical protein ACE5HV_12200 [Acidobacteriota bacterium]
MKSTLGRLYLAAQVSWRPHTFCLIRDHMRKSTPCVERRRERYPLPLSACGAEMKITAFITEHATVRHILTHIQMPAQRPEPLAHSPPLQDELL